MFYHLVINFEIKFQSHTKCLVVDYAAILIFSAEIRKFT